jgi:hypothetical protein
MMTAHLSSSQIWGMPITIGVVSAVGLVSALLGDGIWDALSWCALAVPIVVPLWYIVRSSQQSPRFSARPQ